MSKHKNTHLMNKKEHNLLHLQLIGIILILLGTISIMRLGFLGYGIYLFMKFMFGDWYFLVILYIILLGIYYLFLCTIKTISKVRILGMFCIFNALIILSHLTMHNYISQFTTFFVKETTNNYLYSLKKGLENQLIGGGIYGMLFFYAIFYLLSYPGIVIISFVLFIFGVSLIIKVSIKDMILFIMKIFKFIKIFFVKISIKILKLIKSLKVEINKEFSHQKHNLIESNMDNLNDYVSDDTYAKKYLEEILNELKKIDYNINIKYRICPHLIIYELDTKKNINLSEIDYNLNNSFFQPYLYRIDENSKLYKIEVLNPKLEKLTLSYMINSFTKHLILGVNDYNENIILDEMHKNALLFSFNLSYFLFLIIETITILKKDVIIISDDVIKLKLHYKIYSFSDLDVIEKIVKGKSNSFNDVKYFFININENITKDKIKKIYYIMELGKTKMLYFIVNVHNLLFKSTRFYDEFSYFINVDIKTKEVLNLFGFNCEKNLCLGQMLLVKDGDLVFRMAASNLTLKEYENFLK